MVSSEIVNEGKSNKIFRKTGKNIQNGPNVL